MHLVDVVIPTRNRAELTLEAVRSVQAQTERRWHLYLVDDASDDGSDEILRTFVATDERITLLRHEKTGRAARARQTGFEAGTAEWVATLDSDDTWTPEKLELQLDAAKACDVVLGWHSWVRPDGSIRTTRRPAGRGSVSPLLTSNVDVALMRRALVERVGGFAGPEALDLAADENIDFFIRLLAEANAVVVPQVVALCRDHSGERTSDRMTPESLQRIVDRHRRLLEEDPEFGAMLCRLGARYLATRQLRRGWQLTLEGFRRAPKRQTPALGLEWLPHALRSTWRSFPWTG